MEKEKNFMYYTLKTVIEKQTILYTLIKTFIKPFVIVLTRTNSNTVGIMITN